MFISGNNDAIDLSTYKPQFEKVFSHDYIKKVEYLRTVRIGLTDDLKRLRNEMTAIQKLIEQEME